VLGFVSLNGVVRAFSADFTLAEFSVRGDEVLVQNSQTLYREEEEGAFLFDPDTGDLKYMNPMGARIFQTCTGEITVDGIVQGLREEYPEIPPDRIRGDVGDFLEEMLRLGFLLLKPSAPGCAQP